MGRGASIQCLAGAYADGTDFNAYVAGLARRVMSSLPWDVFVLSVGLALVAWGQFSERIKTFLGLPRPGRREIADLKVLNARLEEIEQRLGALKDTNSELHRLTYRVNQLQELLLWERRQDKLQRVRASIEKLDMRIGEEFSSENKDATTSTEIDNELQVVMDIFVQQCGYDFGELVSKLNDVTVQLDHECKNGHVLLEDKERESFKRRLLLLKCLVDDHENEAYFRISAKLEPWLLKGF